MRRIIFLVGSFIGLTIIGQYFRNGSESHTRSGIEISESKMDEPAKFLEFHRGIRTRHGEADPTYPSGYKWDELQKSRSILARERRSGMRTKANGVLEWKERGPGNVPGRTRAVYNVPGDPDNNTWLAGSATGGIWRTTDGGNTWTERSANFPAMPISSFASDASGSVIYAGTGEYVSSVFSASGHGIYKSTDKGITWTQVSGTNDPEFTITTRVIVDPANANTILATTVPSNLSTDNTSAIMRSTNGGVTWTKVKEITGFFEQIIATPSNFNIQYASQNDVGVWKSSDGGLTWSLSNSGMTVNGRVEIAVSPVNANRIYAAAEGTRSGLDADFYMSTDGAVSWSLVDIKHNNLAFDFFEGQGFYDNVVMCDPFDENKVYFGGVSLFRATTAASSGAVDNYHIIESGTSGFMFLQAFANILHDNARLTVGGFNRNAAVEVRFGPGITSKAHRFLVPVGATSGVPIADYTYQNYVDVPFQVWDVANNKQLMASFRDQNRNGKFDLIPSGFPEGAPGNHSREYFYIHDVDYSPTTPATQVALPGGHEFRLMYNFFPALASGATWDENNLPASKLIIRNDPVTTISATLVTVADGRNAFGGKNKSNQVNLAAGVHPDHHFMAPVIISQTAKTYKIILGNDGGVFVSKVGTDPGITEGDWSFKGFGYNTSQFYGADKRPGLDQYIGGMQDNGTRMSAEQESAHFQSAYTYAIGGDGFEVIWHSKDPNLIMGSIYNAQLQRSVNGGSSWAAATTGFTPGSDFSFVTKIANSRDYPDRVFIAGMQGVYRSNDFGGSWSFIPISQKFVLGTPFYLDVEVSRANANIVWAGSGMNNTGTLRNLHVSTDGGTTFAPTNNYTTVPLGNITKLASHPTEQNTAYALFSFSGAPKILRTTDLGNSWTDISGFGTGNVSTNGFPNVAVYCLYVRPDNTNIIWAGTEIGIVESQDNGNSWAILDDFPNVSVWDMKGQDNQVVIATHGRGIWTATISQSQLPSKGLEIIASGTAPNKTLAVRVQTTQACDSAHVFVSNVLKQRLYNVTAGVTDFQFPNIPTGYNDIKIISYKGNVPTQSMNSRPFQLNLMNAAGSYSTYFKTLTEAYFEGVSMRNFPGQTPTRQALQTEHKYLNNKNYEVVLTKPVIVASANAKVYYSDIAITEPGVDKVFIEATKNGLDWVALEEGHDASSNPQWAAAFNDQTEGTHTMFDHREVNILDKFQPGDLLLFRMRMTSNATVNGWGWALNYVSIQEAPVGVENPDTRTVLNVYPNPATESFTVNYSLAKQSAVSFNVLDMYGKQVVLKSLGVKNPGSHSEPIDVRGLAGGNYIIVVNSIEGKKTRKISVVR